MAVRRAIRHPRKNSGRSRARQGAPLPPPFPPCSTVADRREAMNRAAMGGGTKGGVTGGEWGEGRRRRARQPVRDDVLTNLRSAAPAPWAQLRDLRPLQARTVGAAGAHQAKRAQRAERLCEGAIGAPELRPCSVAAHKYSPGNDYLARAAVREETHSEYQNDYTTIMVFVNPAAFPPTAAHRRRAAYLPGFSWLRAAYPAWPGPHPR